MTVIWSGWPPQVWNGKDWVPIPEAELIVQLTAENKRLKALLEDIGAPLAAKQD